jgi:ADP-ribose pyrophosphatase YjhB (NUDIX family)
MREDMKRWEQLAAPGDIIRLMEAHAAAARREAFEEAAQMAKQLTELDPWDNAVELVKRLCARAAEEGGDG